MAVGGQPPYKTEQRAISLPCDDKFFPEGPGFC